MNALLMVLALAAPVAEEVAPTALSGSRYVVGEGWGCAFVVAAGRWGRRRALSRRVSIRRPFRAAAVPGR